MLLVKFGFDFMISIYEVLKISSVGRGGWKDIDWAYYLKIKLLTMASKG